MSRRDRFVEAASWLLAAAFFALIGCLLTCCSAGRPAVAEHAATHDTLYVERNATVSLTASDMATLAARIDSVRIAAVEHDTAVRIVTLYGIGLDASRRTASTADAMLGERASASSASEAVRESKPPDRLPWAWIAGLGALALAAAYAAGRWRRS